MASKKPSQWKHPKKKEIREGHYEVVAKNKDRVFQLVGAKNVLTFESYQMAKSLGWYKI